jgi:uncharacterized protein YgiM (DUF1202 family)
VLWSGPGTDYAFIAELPAGMLLEIVGRSENGAWTVVRLAGGTEGWIPAEDLETATDLSLLAAIDDPPVPPPTETPLPAPTVYFSNPTPKIGVVIILFYSGFAPGDEPTVIVSDAATGEILWQDTLPEVGGNGQSSVRIWVHPDTIPGVRMYTVVGSDGRSASALLTIEAPEE